MIGPADALARLRDGNQRFVANETTATGLSRQARATRRFGRQCLMRTAGLPAVARRAKEGDGRRIIALCHSSGLESLSVAMPIIPAVLISLIAFGAQATGSSVDPYAVFLDKAVMRGGCSVRDGKQFRNRAYQFRGRMHGDTLVLRDGKALELDALGKPDWETELVQQTVVALGSQSAVMLRFVANHVGGSGSWVTVLIGTCSDRQLTVVFEAESQGLGDVALTTGGVLVVKRAVWSASDAQCCPSGKAEEQYRWDRDSGRFVRIGAR